MLHGSGLVNRFPYFFFFIFVFWRTVNCKIYWSLFPKQFLTLHQNWFPNTYCSVREVFNTKLMLDQTQTLRECLNFFRDGLFFKISFGILRKLFSAFAPALNGFLTENECSRSFPFKLLVPVRLIAVITASSHSCPIF